MRYLIIGDIHGCFDEMFELISKAALSDEDQIISLGDLIDRGPNSLAVVNFFMISKNRFCISLIHKEKHIRLFSGNIKPAPAQQKFIEQISKEECRKVVDYFRCLPLYLKLPQALLIHGMLEPGIEIQNQKKSVIIGSMSGSIYLMKKYPKPWYEHYHDEMPVIAGHHDYSGKGEPKIIQDKLFLIDTGCCYGKKLTGLILPEFRIISIKSRKNYWALSMQNNKKQKRD